MSAVVCETCPHRNKLVLCNPNRLTRSPYPQDPRRAKDACSQASMLHKTFAALQLLAEMDRLSNAAMQAVELKVSEVLFVGTCDNSAGSYPLAKCRMSMEVG